MEQLQEFTALLSGVWDYVLKQPAHILLIAVLNVIGFGLKRLKPFPNDYIDATLIALSMLAYPFLTVTGSVSFEWNTFVFGVCYGAILGFIAIILHRAVLKKSEPIVRKIPFVGEAIAEVFWPPKTVSPDAGADASVSPQST